MFIQFELLYRRPLLLRLDVLPFVVAYIWLALWSNGLEDTQENVMLFVYSRIIFIAIAFMNSLVFLSSYWSPHLKARVQFFSGGKKINSQNLQKYPYIKAYFKKPSGSFCDIILIQKNEEYYFFKFMENKFIFDDNLKTFYRLKPNLKFDILTLADIQKNMKSSYFDKNSLLIPMKKFVDVLKEQLMEPFSFFQIFSISLWLLDENQLYALFTLFLLFVTGCTVAIQRMRTMLTLRQMKLNPAYITVYRNKGWTKISSEDLVPGDVCIIQTADQAKPIVQTQPASQQNLPNRPGVQQVTLTEEEQFFKDQVPMNKYLPHRLFKSESMNVDSFKNVPCDILLLNGSVVVNEAMLTGESVPQVKDSIEQIHHSEILDIKAKHKSNVLFCGTEVLQVQGNVNYPNFIEKVQPQPHCLGLVLRTGFDTSKGKLIRTVFYNNENNQIRQFDGLVIVLVLLIFALISSGYVLFYGLEDEKRDKNKLFLRCILIVTTVVPPELPMILSIAVNQSLLFLQMKKIFCTEPYRIPWAGKVTVLAFDKTGTLTNDTLKFLGIVDEPTLKLKQRTEANLDTQSILAGCQSLVYADHKLQGDPIEVLFFESNNQWNYSAVMKTANNTAHHREVTIRSVYPFKSDLKRMSTLVIQQDNFQNKVVKVLTKGAPEIIEPLLKEVPAGFTQAYEHFADKGYRVICLADREINVEEFDIDPTLMLGEQTLILSNLDRSVLETKLTFRGFLICESPLKPDTALWISKFKASYFNSVIITGDNLLTAIAIGKLLKFHETKTGQQKKVAVLESNNYSEFKLVIQNDDKLVIQAQKEINISKKDLSTKLQSVVNEYMLCLPSHTITALEGHPQLDKIMSLFTIFARATPKQKELVMLAFRNAGFGVLMCGDGTNDVGALKKAHVGIALVTKYGNADEKEDEDDDEDDQMSFTQQLQKAKQQREEMQRKMQQARGNPQQMKNLASQQFQQATSDIFDMGNSYKFGDACIAAPFTSKMSTSIRCVHTILKQGICTLVTTIQTYKIMALLSLINAYSLSSLHMQSLKLSETQMTLMGILGAAYYFCYSNSKAQRQLAQVKPSFTIFEFTFIFSLLAQIVLHILTMDYALHQIGILYSSEEELKVDNDAQFTPTFLNTVVFLIQLLQQSCIFLFNHPGEPHMLRIDIKSKFFKSLIIPLSVCILCAFNLSEDLNYMFELKFPSTKSEEASQKLGCLCFFIAIVNYLIERVMKYLKYGQFYGYI